MIRAAYARYRAGDLTPTRYHAQKEGGVLESIVHIPLMVEGQFRGIAELIWNERADLVFDGWHRRRAAQPMWAEGVRRGNEQPAEISGAQAARRRYPRLSHPRQPANRRIQGES